MASPGRLTTRPATSATSPSPWATTWRTPATRRSHSWRCLRATTLPTSRSTNGWRSHRQSSCRPTSTSTTRRSPGCPGPSRSSRADGDEAMTTSERLRSTRATEPEVRTTAGMVRGRQEDDLAVFRGIPFAEPPVGEARFAAPRPAHGWHGAREAFSFGPPPPQDSAALQAVTGHAGTPRRAPDDDWLTVNVWTPDPDPAAHRPVMVWIYGGAYRFGSGGVDSHRIAHDGSLVVVTFNYREGV